MSKINSRSKGARGEREFAAFLTERGHEARRGQQFKGGDESPDVLTSLPIHFEVKRVEGLSLYPAMAQAVRDANGTRMPVVAHRRNGKEWLAVLRMEDLLELFKEHCKTRPVRRIIRRA